MRKNLVNYKNGECPRFVQLHAIECGWGVFPPLLLQHNRGSAQITYKYIHPHNSCTFCWKCPFANLLSKMPEDLLGSVSSLASAFASDPWGAASEALEALDKLFRCEGGEDEGEDEEEDGVESGVERHRQSSSPSCGQHWVPVLYCCAGVAVLLLSYAALYSGAVLFTSYGRSCDGVFCGFLSLLQSKTFCLIFPTFDLNLFQVGK